MFKHFLAAIAVVIGISAYANYNSEAVAADRGTVYEVYDKIKAKFPDADKIIVTDKVASYAIIDALVKANLVNLPNFAYDNLVIIRSEAANNSMIVLLNGDQVVGSGVIPLTVLGAVLREAFNGA